MQDSTPNVKLLVHPKSGGLTRQTYVDAQAARNPQQQQGSNSGLDHWALLRRRKLLLTASAILGGVAGFALLLFQKPVYQAITTIELQGFNESFMNMNTVDPQAGTGSYSSNQSNINTQLRIIESASVRMPVLERLQRETTPIGPPSTDFFAKLRLRAHRSAVDPLEEMKAGLIMATKSLKAKSVLGTRIISVTCESTIPDIAANFANTVASEYIAQNTQLRSTTTQKTSQWLESQLEETKVKLEQAEARLQEFARKSGVTFVGEQDTLAGSKLKQLQSDLAAIQADRIAKQTKAEMVKASPPDSIPDIIEDGNLRMYQSKLADLRRELAQLTPTLTPEHFKVKQVQAQINELQATLQKERDNVIQRINNEYTAAQRRENLLVAAYNGQAAALSAQADKASEYSLLKREVDIYRQTLNIMLQQVNQAAVVSAVPANNIRIVDSAIPPPLPYKPSPGYFLGGGLVFGAGLGFGLVILKERASNRKSSLTFGVPGYASSVLDVPELGVIPSADFESAEKLRQAGPRWKRSKVPIAMTSGKGAEIKNQGLIAWQGTPSLMAESFRLTLTSILLMNRNGEKRHTLVVTSPGPGEGKTTVSSNIAVAMAEAGQKVLVIDMDLRKPRVHTVFGVSNDRGFSDLVRSTEPVSTVAADPAIHETTVPRVYILPSGTLELNGISELFHSPRVSALLKELQKSFDTILIDTPPMLHFSESRIVASFADGVILVLRSGFTDKESALAAREQLSMDGIALLGTILNDWNPKIASKNPYHSAYTAYMHYQDRARS
jgi:capsular exopolysaccharide synthesis family protein